MSFGLQMIYGWICIPLLNEITSWGLCLGIFLAFEDFINAILFFILSWLHCSEKEGEKEKVWFIFTTSILTFISSLAYILLEIMDSKHRSKCLQTGPPVSLKDEVNFENILRPFKMTVKQYEYIAVSKKT